MRGITLLSLNSPSYGKFALTMMASIKANCDLPVQLIYDKASIGHIKEHLDKFDVLTEILPEDCSTEYQFDPARAKINLYKYLATDFTEVIYLDVDGICTGDINEYFDILKDEYIHIQGMAHVRPSHWAEAKKVNRYIELNGELRDINSSFIYIKKSEQASNFFELVKLNYDTGKLPRGVLRSRWGRIGYPDELFFSIAMSQLNMVSHNNIAPVYFNNHKDNVNKQMEESNSKILSLYGNIKLNNSEIIYKYDHHAHFYLENLGIPYIWSARKIMKDKYVNN